MTTVIKFVVFIVLTSVKTSFEQERVDAYTTSCPLPLPRDCGEVAQSGCRKAGIYAIDPGHGKPMYVYCRWSSTVILRQKFGGSENFNRSWEDYVNGFGDLEGEFWLGLEKMRQLTFNSANPHKNLVASVFTESGLQGFPYYSSFVDSSETNYTLVISHNSDNFYPNIKKYLNLQSGMQFSTYDRDNDRDESVNCALRHGAWWYNTCASLNDNIQYLGEPLQTTSGSTSMRVVEMSI